MVFIKGLTKFNVFTNDNNDLIVAELFESRGGDVRKDNICLQIQLSKEEINQLIDYLKTLTK